MTHIPIEWQSIETVFLDLDGTLLDLHYDNYFWLKHMPQCYAEHYGIPIEEASRYLLKQADLSKGSLDWYSIDFWEQRLGMDIVPLKHQVSHKIAVRDNAVAFLRFLREQDKQIVLLTNAHPKTLAVKFCYVDINQYFDVSISSYEIGLAKEEAGFWERLNEQNAFDAQRSLFIDDTVEVLDNAKRYGISFLLGVAQPDSQQLDKDAKDYFLIDNFRQLII